MSERPTEALRYAVDQHLHDRSHNASDTDKCRASAREVLTEYDALDAKFAALTAEVGRLREAARWRLRVIQQHTDLSSQALMNPRLVQMTLRMGAEMYDAALRQDSTEVDALTPPADQLIDRAKRVEMTPEEREAQRRSFAYGNAAIDNPNVTREMVDAAADAMPAPATKPCPRCNGTKWQGGCIGSKFAPCKLCRDVNGEPTGRVPATEDDNAVSGEGGG